MKKSLIAAVLILGLVATQSAFAGGHGKRGSGGWGHGEGHQKCKVEKLKKKMKFLYMHKDELNLTNDQIDAIKDIKRNAVKQLIQYKAEAKIIKVDIKSGMMEPTIDVDTINDLIDQKFVAKKKAAKTFVKAIADVKNVLSAEQKEQMRDLMMKSKFAKGGCTKCPKSKGSHKGSMK